MKGLGHHEKRVTSTDVQGEEQTLQERRKDLFDSYCGERGGEYSTHVISETRHP
jgi:hypothetical protein